MLNILQKKIEGKWFVELTNDDGSSAFRVRDIIRAFLDNDDVREMVKTLLMEKERDLRRKQDERAAAFKKDMDEWIAKNPKKKPE